MMEPAGPVHRSQDLRAQALALLHERPRAIKANSHQDEWGINEVFARISSSRLEGLSAEQLNSYRNLDEACAQFRVAQSNQHPPDFESLIQTAAVHLRNLGIACEVGQIERKESSAFLNDPVFGELVFPPIRSPALIISPLSEHSAHRFNRFAAGLARNHNQLQLSFDPEGLFTSKAGAFFDPDTNRIGLSTFAVTRAHLLKDELALGLGHEVRHAIVDCRLRAGKASPYFGSIHHVARERTKLDGYMNGFRIDEALTHWADMKQLQQQSRSASIQRSDLTKLCHSIAILVAERTKVLCEEVLNCVEGRGARILKPDHIAYPECTEDRGVLIRAAVFCGESFGIIEFPLIDSTGPEDPRNLSLYFKQATLCRDAMRRIRADVSRFLDAYSGQSQSV